MVTDRVKKQQRKASKTWYQKNRKKVLARHRARREADPETWNRKKRKWYHDNKDKMSEYHQSYRARWREKLLVILGGKCVICGETNKRWLHLDRIKGGPHDRSPKWIHKNIKQFQILCANHHNEKTVYKEIKQ